MKISPPAVGEYPPYYTSYIGQVVHDDLIAALPETENYFLEFTRKIPAAKADYRYAEGKWSIKEVLIHTTDAERIFAYRALRFARNDKTELAGFDEEKYVPYCNPNRSLQAVIDEHNRVREATIALFNSFTEEMWMRQGTANGNVVTVRALGYIIVGHTLHHLRVINERYLHT